jgi:hypothetical protein
MFNPRWKSSNYYVVIAIESAYTSGVSSNPASEGMSSIDDSLVVEESSSLDITSMYRRSDSTRDRTEFQLLLLDFDLLLATIIQSLSL